MSTASSTLIDSVADPTIPYKSCEIAADLPLSGNWLSLPSSDQDPHGAIDWIAAECRQDYELQRPATRSAAGEQ